MLRLFTNDFRLNAVLIFGLFFLFNIQLILMGSLIIHGEYGFGGMQSGILFASAMVVAVFLREEENKGQIINRSLPVSHTKVVCARYFSIFVFVTACVLYGLFFWFVVASSIKNTYVHVHFLRFLTSPYFAVTHFLMAWALASSATIAIAVPLIFRFGTFWRILIGYVAVMAGWSRGVPYLLHWSHSAALFFGELGWILLGGVLMIAVVSGSIRLSIWLYGKKDL